MARCGVRWRRLPRGSVYRACAGCEIAWTLAVLTLITSVSAISLAVLGLPLEREEDEPMVTTMAFSGHHDGVQHTPQKQRNPRVSRGFKWWSVPGSNR